MNLPKVVLRRDPQILAALVAAKQRLAWHSEDVDRYMMVCLALPDSSVADEIRTAIALSMDTNTLWQWLARQGHVLMDVELQALRHQWLDGMILDQIVLPEVKLRKRPEIKAILLEAKDRLRTTYAGHGHGFVCHAVSQAGFILDLNDFLEEVHAGICKPLGEVTASSFFKRQYAGLNSDQCQILRHRWLDQMIGEQ